MLEVKIEESWRVGLREIFEQDYFQDIVDFVKKEYQEKVVYPKASNIFRAFNLCPVERVSVVIVGQDPYHEKNQANGLAFSVNAGEKLPPSLQNIYKELSFDLGIDTRDRNGELTSWAEQGVFLINSILTVREHEAGAHKDCGWEKFTDDVIKFLNKTKQNLVYILWGSHAQKKCSCIDRSQNLVLCSPHPSPLSAHRGFFHNNFFSKTNKYLADHGKKEIVW